MTLTQDKFITAAAIQAQVQEDLRFKNVWLNLVQFDDFENDSFEKVYINESDVVVRTATETGQIIESSYDQTFINLRGVKGATLIKRSLEAELKKRRASVAVADGKVAKAMASWADQNIADIVPLFNRSVGSDATPMTEALLRESNIIFRQDNNVGDIVTVLRVEQMGDLEDDLINKTAAPYQSQISLSVLGDVQPNGGNGFRGAYMGMSLYESQHLRVSDGGDSFTGVMLNVDRALVGAIDGRIYTMEDDNPERMVRSKSYAMFMGIQIRDNDSGVRIVSAR